MTVSLSIRLSLLLSRLVMEMESAMVRTLVLVSVCLTGRVLESRVAGGFNTLFTKI